MGEDICEYCNRGGVVLYALMGDAWCADCVRRRGPEGAAELLDAAPLGRPRDARYDVPFVLQTPDGRVQDGVVCAGR